MEYIKNKKILLIIILGIILLISTMLYYIKDESEELEDITLLTTTKQITTKTEMIFVDIKGSVNKPGVYKFNINDRVIDQTTTNMIQGLKGIFARKPLISIGI